MIMVVLELFGVFLAVLFICAFIGAVTLVVLLGTTITVGTRGIPRPAPSPPPPARREPVDIRKGGYNPLPEERRPPPERP